MSKISDQRYLLTQQYRNASNLEARIQLHRRFSTNRTNWYDWLFDHYTLTPGSRILELGCGPASLWQHVQERIPQDGRSRSRISLRVWFKRQNKV